MLTIYAILTCLMIVVILTDTSRYIIPNWLVLALTVLYPVAVTVSHARPDWKIACVVALIAFLIGAILLLPFMGAGDIKLLVAATLYTGTAALMDFVIYVAILGGLGSLLLLLLRAFAPYMCLKLGKTGEAIPRVLTSGEPVPYGVAIAIAFLALLWDGKLPGLVL